MFKRFRQNQLDSAWGLSLVEVQNSLSKGGFAGSSGKRLIDEADIFMLANSLVNKASENGLDQRDAIALGRAYFLAAYKDRYPDEILEKLLQPSPHEVATAIRVRYGETVLQRLSSDVDQLNSLSGSRVPPSTQIFRPTEAVTLVVATESGLPLAVIDSPSIDRLVEQGWMTRLPDVKALQLATKSMCEAISEQVTKEPLFLLVCSLQGDVFGIFDADPNEGYVSSLSACDQFLDAVKQCLARRQVLERIDIGKDTPRKDFSMARFQSQMSQPQS